MKYNMLNKIFASVVVVSIASSASAQQEDELPPHLISPNDACIDTLGEVIDARADEIGLPRIIFRNMVRQILDDAAAGDDRDRKPQPGEVFVPPFNEKIDELEPGLARIMGILVKDPTAPQRLFGQGCDLEI